MCSLSRLAALAALLLAGCHLRGEPAPVPVAPEKPGLGAEGVDRLLQAAWKAKGVQPGPAVDDARFLRRATLDLTGTLPTPEAVRAFLADRAPDKRARAVDALLASPAYADHWTDYWEQELLGNRVSGNLVDRGAFRRWLRAEFAANAPWNQLVFDLVSASGQNSVGGVEVRKPGGLGADDPELRAAEARAGVNGAVNWLLRYADAPQDAAGTVSRAFLGVQIQCAQCHDHKTEAWRQTDFQGFAASFAKTKLVRMDKGEAMGIRRAELRDEDRRTFGGKKATPELQAIAAARPTALDGTDLGASPRPRRALAGWLVSDQNPWFAQALVNRLWARLLGRGFVEPYDDLRPGNPTAAPELLAALSRDFAEHGYDLKRLLRTITLSEAYGRAAGPATDDDLWAHARLRPLGPDELLNALLAATQLRPALSQAGAAPESLEEVRMKLRREFTFLFDVDEDSSDDGFNGTIPQALLLLNGPLVNRAVRPAPGTTLAQVMAMPGGDDARITELYLRTLSRPPTPEELAAWGTFVAQAEAGAERLPKGGGDPLKALRGQPVRDRAPRVQAYEDLFWALLNSSEFSFNH